ncbi:MAG: L-lactate dehydrogenase [Erysipelotrichaceae bacterium]|nr:L-lactate dehydrogenase [Erysipelotrichaceae bacterium]
MKKDRKVVLVGTGFVGMSMAYSFLSTGGVDELVLIDVDTEKSIGETMDLQHGLPYARQNMVIKAGGYEECANAEVVVITAGIAQKPEQTRLDMTATNTKIMKSIVENIMASGFDGILVIASNPVDLMSYVAQKVSKLPPHRVIGSGTILDTARLRYLMSEYLGISSTNIHALIMGEHGDSSFVPWTHAYIGTKNLLEYLDEEGRDLQDLNEIYHQVQRAAYEIINRKKATYYGIGLSLNRLVHAILDDENAILTLSVLQNNEFNQEGLYIGVPAQINKQGIQKIIKFELNAVDQAKFNLSVNTLKEIITSTIDPILENASTL